MFKPDSSVAVWGLGGVGMAAILGCRSLKVKQIIAIDVVQSRLGLALELGATHVIDGRTPNVKEQISDITHGEMLDMTIDASGVSSCVELAWSCLAAGGVHGQLGGFSPGTMAPIDLASGVHYQKTLKGAIMGDAYPPDMVATLIDMYKKGELLMEKICKVFPVEKFKDAIAAMHDGSVIKPILVFP